VTREVTVHQPFDSQVSESVLRLGMLAPRLNCKIVGECFGGGNAEKGAMGQ
jgi:hypothetical protein